jgi:hypothetical protein
MKKLSLLVLIFCLIPFLANGWVLKDEFTTALTAGNINTTTAEPVGGARSVTDTSTALVVGYGTAAHTSHNGQESGVMDLNGGMYEVNIGMTAIASDVAIGGMSRANPCVVTINGHGLADGSIIQVNGITQADWVGAKDKLWAITLIDENSFSIAFDASAFGTAYDAGTDPGTITKGTFYAAKQATAMKSFTSGESLATDHWGATGVAAMMDALSVETVATMFKSGNDGLLWYGSGSYQVLDGAVSGESYTKTGLGLVKSGNAVDGSGSNLFGRDYYYQHIENNLCLLSCMPWVSGSNAGIWSVNLSDYRTNSNHYVGGRAAAYPNGTLTNANIPDITIGNVVDAGVADCPVSILPTGFTKISTGNYQYIDGSVMVFIPKFYYKISTNTITILPASTYADTTAANADGAALHRAFIDGGSEQAGFFVDKYKVSTQAWGTGYIASSLKDGNPISTASTHNPVATVTAAGANGYYAMLDAVKGRGETNGVKNASSIFFINSRFIQAALAMYSLAHGQAVTSATYAAWYDSGGTTNFPKGCNTGYLKDANNFRIGYKSDGYSASASSNSCKTGGTLTDSDTTGKLSFLGGNAAGNPGLWYTQLTRVAGRTLIGEVTPLDSINAGIEVGYDANTSGALTNSIQFGAAGALNIVNNGGTAITVGSYTAASHKLGISLRTTGAYYWAKLGADTSWKLYWLGLGDSGNVYPAITVLGTKAHGTLDFLRIPNTLWLPSPLASDGFSVSGTTDGKGHAEGVAGGIGEGGGGLAWQSGGSTWSVSGGKAVNTAPSGISQQVETVSASTADMLATVSIAAVSAGEKVGLVTNLDSVSNPQNYILSYHDGTNVKLDKVVAGSATGVISAETAFSANAELRVIKDGTTYRLYYNDTLIGTATISDASIISNTRHGLFSTDASNTLDNFTLYARGTGNEYNILNQLMSTTSGGSLNLLGVGK